MRSGGGSREKDRFFGGEIGAATAGGGDLLPSGAAARRAQFQHGLAYLRARRCGGADSHERAGGVRPWAGTATRGAPYISCLRSGTSRCAAGSPWRGARSLCPMSPSWDVAAGKDAAMIPVHIVYSQPIPPTYSRRALGWRRREGSAHIGSGVVIEDFARAPWRGLRCTTRISEAASRRPSAGCQIRSGRYRARRCGRRGARSSRPAR